MTTLARLRSMYILQRIANIKKQSSSGGDGGSGSLSGVISRPPSIDLLILNEWVGFINLFDSLVHDRSDLTASYNMAHLQRALRGEPRELVAHLPITNVAMHSHARSYSTDTKIIDGL